MSALETTDWSTAAAHWPFLPVLPRLGLAVALGIFVGLEREHNQKTGVRTFSLAALACCLGGLMGTLYAAFALAFVGVGIVGMNYREMAKTQKLALIRGLPGGRPPAGTGVIRRWRRRHELHALAQGPARVGKDAACRPLRVPSRFSGGRRLGPGRRRPNIGRTFC